MTLTKYFVMILAALAFGSNCSDAKPILTNINDITQTYHIPLIDSKRFPVVSVSIDGSTSLKFIIDTGAQRTLLSPHARRTLNLERTQARSLNLQGLEGETEGIPLAEKKIKLGTSQLNCPVSMLSLANSAVENNSIYKMVFSKYDGILGMDYFYGTQLTIDGQNKKIQVSVKEKNGVPMCGQNFTSAAVVKKEHLARRVMLQVKFANNDFEIMADSGLADNKVIMLLPNDKTDNVRSTVSEKFTMANVPLLGNLPLKLALFPKVIISENPPENLMVLIPSPADTRFSRNSDIGGLIGWKYLRYGVLDIDFMTKGMKYASFSFNDNWDDRNNLSGLREGLEMTPENELVFSRVDPNSPADIAGIKVGDKIIKINGTSLSPKNMGLIVDALTLKKGTTQVVILRDKKYLEKTLIFNDYLLQPQN